MRCRARIGARHAGRMGCGLRGRPAPRTHDPGAQPSPPPLSAAPAARESATSPAPWLLGHPLGRRAAGLRSKKASAWGVHGIPRRAAGQSIAPGLRLTWAVVANIDAVGGRCGCTRPVSALPCRRQPSSTATWQTRCCLAPARRRRARYSSVPTGWPPRRVTRRWLRGTVAPSLSGNGRVVVREARAVPLPAAFFFPARLARWPVATEEVPTADAVSVCRFVSAARRATVATTAVWGGGVLFFATTAYLHVYMLHAGVTPHACMPRPGLLCRSTPPRGGRGAACHPGGPLADQRIGAAAGGVVVDMVVALLLVSPRSVRSRGGGRRGGGTHGEASGPSQPPSIAAYRLAAVRRRPTAVRCSPAWVALGEQLRCCKAPASCVKRAAGCGYLGSSVIATCGCRCSVARVQCYYGTGKQKFLPPVGWSYHSNPRPSDY